MAAGTDWQDASWSALPWRMCGFDSRWALSRFRTWESLVIPPVSGTGNRWVESSRPDSHCGGARAGTGRRLLSAPTQVRFLSPQLSGLKPTARSREHGVGILTPGSKLRAPRSIAGSSNGRTRRFERRDVGPTPTPAAVRQAFQPDKNTVSQAGKPDLRKGKPTGDGSCLENSRAGHPAAGLCRVPGRP